MWWLCQLSKVFEQKNFCLMTKGTFFVRTVKRGLAKSFSHSLFPYFPMQHPYKYIRGTIICQLFGWVVILIWLCLYPLKPLILLDFRWNIFCRIIVAYIKRCEINRCERVRKQIWEKVWNYKNLRSSHCIAMVGRFNFVRLDGVKWLG